MDIALLFALILLNGVFAMSEIAIVSSRKARLIGLADDGNRGAQAAVRLHEDPSNFFFHDSGRHHFDRHSERGHG